MQPGAVHPSPMILYILFALAGVAKLIDVSMRRATAIAESESEITAGLSDRYDSSGNRI